MLNTPLIDLPCAPSALTNAPTALAEHASNFSCFNPSVLPPAAERAAGSTPPPLLAFFRVGKLQDVPWASDQMLASLPLQQVWPTVSTSSGLQESHSGPPRRATLDRGA